MALRDSPELSEIAIRNYIGGTWIQNDGPTLSLENPGTGSPLGTVYCSDKDVVDEAVDNATVAFDDWRTTPVEARIQPLFRFKQLLEDHEDEIAEAVVVDHGKTMSEARGEVRRGIENVEVACGIPSMMQSGMLENAAPEIDETAIRQPLGVFAAITPFNFPAMIPLWFLPYAVATGNTFILKPSEQTPLAAQRLFELLDQAGLPDGVVGLLNGGPETVLSLLEHDGVEGISFVGSTPVAKKVYAAAAEQGKRVQAQGGAKNHVVVSADSELPFAAEQTVGSAFACAGERCLANDVALVVDSVYDEFCELVLAEARERQVGYGLADDSDIGALISASHKERIEGFIEQGSAEGADLLLDGRDRPVDSDGGHYLGPTIFGEVTQDMTIAREELFGPILGVGRVESVGKAIDWINTSEFGNAVSLFTNRGAEARTFRQDVNVGNIGVNVGTAAPMAFFHFGGRNASFFGDLHAQGQDMISFYTDETIYIERWPSA